MISSSWQIGSDIALVIVDEWVVLSCDWNLAAVFVQVQKYIPATNCHDLPESQHFCSLSFLPNFVIRKRTRTSDVFSVLFWLFSFFLCIFRLPGGRDSSTNYGFNLKVSLLAPRNSRIPRMRCVSCVFLWSGCKLPWAIFIVLIFFMSLPPFFPPFFISSFFTFCFNSTIPPATLTITHPSLTPPTSSILALFFFVFMLIVGVLNDKMDIRKADANRSKIRLKSESSWFENDPFGNKIFGD